MPPHRTTLQHEGRTYSATYEVVGDAVIVYHHYATKRAELHGLSPSLMAEQLLRELVTRDGRGCADEPA
jgi:hypothetical protein